MCFIVDANGNCNGGKVEKFNQDCSAKGYTYDCAENGHVGVGSACDGKYKSCECRAKYKYTKNSGDDTKYDFGDGCTLNGVTKYSYKRCKSTYQYAQTAISASGNILTAKACATPAELGGETCTEEMLSDTLRYTTCTCPSSYQHTSNNVGTGFAVSGNSCTDVNGTKYDGYKCAADYQTKGTCPTGQKDFNEQTKGAMKCVQCTNKTCSDYQEDGIQLRSECGAGYKQTAYTKALGSENGTCYKCVKAYCSEFSATGQNAYKSVDSSGTCPSGFKSSNFTPTSTTLSCKKCEPYLRCEDYNSSYYSSCGTGYKAVKLSTKHTLVLPYYVGSDGIPMTDITTTEQQCVTCQTKTCTDEGYKGECSPTTAAFGSTNTLPDCSSACEEGYESEYKKFKFGSNPKYTYCYKCMDAVLNECTCLDRMLNTTGKYCRYDGTGYRLEDSGCSK